jgi:pimeloyl-ACP methyl ester carboxylesterase
MGLFHYVYLKLLARLIIVLVSYPTIQAKSQTPPPMSEPCKILAIGFVGGMRSPKDTRQGVVQIGDRLRSLTCPGLQVNTYSHWKWKQAYSWIYQVADKDQDGCLSEKEIESGPKIIVYGHSMGGWAVIKLARRLEKARIPVELAVQIDSVGLGDEVVPRNVKSAANYYQRTVWPIRGEKRIKARDENETKILGNFLVKNIGHEALAREQQISDFIAEKVLLLCGQRLTPVAAATAQ